jgi:hypothetical protein
MGIKPFPHFGNLLHTFAIQYKIKVQGNIETVCGILRSENGCVFCSLMNESFEYRSGGVF